MSNQPMRPYSCKWAYKSSSFYLNFKFACKNRNQNTYKREIEVMHFNVIDKKEFYKMSELQFLVWVRREIITFEVHEVDEFFLYNKKRIFDPHHDKNLMTIFNACNNQKDRLVDNRKYAKKKAA